LWGGGHLPSKVAAQVPASTFNRIIGTKRFRTLAALPRAGSDLTDVPIGAVRPLVEVANDLAHGSISVSQVHNRIDRERYIDSVFAKLNGGPSPQSKKTSTEPLPTGPGRGLSRTSGKPPLAPRSHERAAVVPPSFQCRPDQQRCAEILDELKALSAERYPNAVSVLLRVFIQLSAEWYAERRPEGLPKPKGNKGHELHELLRHLADRLHSEGGLNTQQHKALRKATFKNEFWSGSVDSMHQSVHNCFERPQRKHLINAWDVFEPLLLAIWAHPK